MRSSRSWKPVVGVSVVLCLLAGVSLAGAQTVLFEDDFDRGWENAMTHAYLPAWSEPSGTFIPPTDLTPWDVEIAVTGDTFAVYVNGEPIAAATDSDLQPGAVGVFSWAQGSGVGSVFEFIGVTDDTGTLLDEDWEVPVLPWRELVPTNSDGVSLSTDRDSIVKELFYDRCIDITNYFVVATESAPNTDFLGAVTVLDVPGSESWTDYEVRCRLFNSDDDGIGLILRGADDDNFYRVNFCNEATQSGSWLPWERAPQGVSVQKCRNGVWSQLTDPNDPVFIYAPGVPFDVSAQIQTNGQGDVGIDITVVDDPDGSPTTIEIPQIVDPAADDPILTGPPGLCQWGSSGAAWINYGGVSTDFVVTTYDPPATLFGDAFTATGFGNWQAVHPPGSDPEPTWGISLQADNSLMENCNGIPPYDTIYVPYMLVEPTVVTGENYTLNATLASSDNDGIGIVFGYDDPNNYFRVGFRAQSGTGYGFPQGTGAWKVVSGITTPLVTAIPPRGAIAGIWMQKLQGMPIEMSDNEGMYDGSGQDRVEFLGPRLVFGDISWTDYAWQTVIDARDNDGIGVLFRYQDEENFYRLTFQDEDIANQGAPVAGISAQRVVNGVWTEIFRDDRSTVDGGFKYDSDGLEAGAESEGFRVWRVRLTCTGPNFDLAIDGIDPNAIYGQVEYPDFYLASFSDTEPDALLNGSVGLHTWFHNANEFREMRLTLAGQTEPEFEIGFGEPDPIGWIDATEATLSDPYNFISINHATDPWEYANYAGVECGPDACALGGYMGAGTPFSGIGLRPDLQALGVRDNRWVSGTDLIEAGNLTRGTVDFDGPRAVAGDTAWTDYVYSVDLKALDDDGLGVLFRYQDEDNFYRLMFQNQAGNVWGGPPRGVSVQKRLAGAFTEVFFTDAFVYTPGETWNVEVTAESNQFDIRIEQLLGDVDGDGQSVYEFAFTDDDNPLLSGRIGVTVWGCEAEANEENGYLGDGIDWTLNFDEGAVFDNVVVAELGPECPGDLDGDNDVDLTDLAILLAHYGMTSGAQYEDGDLDGDEDVDLADLAALLSVYGTSC